MVHIRCCFAMFRRIRAGYNVYKCVDNFVDKSEFVWISLNWLYVQLKYTSKIRAYATNTTYCIFNSFFILYLVYFVKYGGATITTPALISKSIYDIVYIIFYLLPGG